MFRQRPKELEQGRVSDDVEPVDHSTTPQTLPGKMGSYYALL